MKIDIPLQIVKRLRERFPDIACEDADKVVRLGLHRLLLEKRG